MSEKLEPFYVKIVDTVEHEDGSATYSFDIDEEARNGLANVGLEFVLYCAATKLDIRDAFDLLMAKAKSELKEPMSNPGDKDYEV